MELREGTKHRKAMGRPERRESQLMAGICETNADTVAGTEAAARFEEAEQRNAEAEAENSRQDNADRQKVQETQPESQSQYQSGKLQPVAKGRQEDEKEALDAREWLADMRRRLRHRTEKSWWEEGRSLATSRGTTGAGGTGTGASFSDVGNGSSSSGGSGGVAGPTQGGSSSKQGSSPGSQEADVDTYVDEFGYPDSPTQSWLAQNSDLSPLQILDNINLKSEFPYSSIQAENDKPPDISNIGMDSTTTTFCSLPPPSLYPTTPPHFWTSALTPSRACTKTISSAT